MPEPKRIPWWLWPNVLSLDAPLVAVFWLAAFAAVFQSPVAPVVYGILFTSVWCIYTADRLIDTRRESGPSTARHQFAARHRIPLAACLTAVAAVTIWLAFTRLEPFVLRTGLGFAAAAGAYFGLFVWKRLPGKEIAAGVIFALGATFPAGSTRPGYQLAVVVLAGLCSLNCFLIEWKEKGSPHPAAAAYVEWSLFGIALGGVINDPAARPLFLFLLTSAAALIILRKIQSRLSAESFRVLADAALLAPLIWLPFLA